jgi:hypothetical protein
MNIPPKQPSLTHLTTEIVKLWNGNDPAFKHRKGGTPYSGTCWNDPLPTKGPHLASAICSIQMPLPPGRYIITWEHDLIFNQSTQCSQATSDFPATQTAVIDFNNHMSIQQTVNSEAYVCAKKTGLVFSEPTRLDFNVVKGEPVEIGFYAYGSDNISLREIIVKTGCLERVI